MSITERLFTRKEPPVSWTEIRNADFLAELALKDYLKEKINLDVYNQEYEKLRPLIKEGTLRMLKKIKPIP